MPGREENVAMIAVASPKRRVSPSASPKGFSVVATQDKEGVRIGGWKLLDAFPSPHEIFQRPFTALKIVILQILKGPADTEGRVSL